MIELTLWPNILITIQKLRTSHVHHNMKLINCWYTDYFLEYSVLCAAVWPFLFLWCQTDAKLVLWLYFYHPALSVLWSDEPFFHQQRERRKKLFEERGWTWEIEVNKVALDLALSVRVPATLITINTVFTGADCSLNEGVYRPIPSLRQALILTHVSLPHVSGSEGEGSWIHWKMGWQVGRITLLWFPQHRNFKALLTAQTFTPSFSCVVL